MQFELQEMLSAKLAFYLMSKIENSIAVTQK